MVLVFIGILLLLVHSFRLSAASNKSCEHMAEKIWHQSPPIENVYLRRAIRQYALMHAKNTNNATELEADLKRGVEKTGTKKRYLYLQLAGGGLGNRMNSILSGFLWALLSNRILLVNENNFEQSFNIDDVFCQPFAGGNWIFPRSKEFADLIRTNYGSRIRGFRDNVEKYMVQEFLDDSCPLVVYTSDGQYLIPMFYLTTNAALRARLDLWFPARNVGHVLSNYIFHPRNEIWRNIKATYKEMKREDPETSIIGIQGRSGIASEILCLSDFKFSNRSHVFIASLGNEKKTVEIKFPKWNVTQTFFEKAQNNSAHQAATAIHDIWLLSMADETILSPGSTLGYQAMLLKGSSCLYPTNAQCKNELRDNSKYPCYRTLSHEACHHQKLNNRLQLERLQASNTLIRCEDAYTDMIGWKLLTLQRR